MNTMKEYTDKIILGDCLEVMPRLEPKSVDMILCDLPYGVTDCAWDVRLPMEKVFYEYKRLLAPRGVIVLTATQPFTTDLINACRPWFRYDLVWDKRFPVGFLNAKRMPMRRHESVLVFYDRLPKYNPQFTEGAPYKSKGHGLKKAGVYKETKSVPTNNPGKRYPTSILEFPRDMNFANHRNLYHPTQKPVLLFKYLISTFTDPGALVLDNCIGAGTTAVACIELGRRFIGIELDPIYAACATERSNEARRRIRSAA